MAGAPSQPQISLWSSSGSSPQNAGCLAFSLTWHFQRTAAAALEMISSGVVTKTRLHESTTAWGDMNSQPGIGSASSRAPWAPSSMRGPIDGTGNLVHRLPLWAISIGLERRLPDGTIETEAGCIYAPCTDEMFWAEKGKGAFVNDRRIRVSKRVQLKECLISTGFPFRPGDNFNHYLLMMGDVMQKTAGLRRPGAAALDLAYVAAGFTDAFFETGLSPWDVAAGSLLVTEAGGLVGNFTGESDFLEQREILAGTPRIYGQLVPILHKYSKFAGAGEKAEVREASRKLGALKRSDAGAAEDESTGGDDAPF